jgi:endonuclease III
MPLTLASLVHDLELEYGEPTRTKRDAEGAVHFQADLIDELVGTILSQNTSDKNSSRAFLSLKKKFPSWTSVIEARTSSIARAIKIGGLAKIKAPRIQRILKEIQTTRGKLSLNFLADMTTSQVMQYLQGFTGVGAKTAACVVMFGLGRDICPVDTHIHRILNRLGLLKTKNADETFLALTTTLKIPKGKSYSLHINLIRHGKQVCQSQRPACERCALAEQCAFAREMM